MKFFKFFLLYILFTSLFSCIPNKDLIYLQDYGNKSEGITVSEFDAKPYRVQVNDLLSINIKAIDQKLVEMFNVSSQQNQSQGAQSIYFSGYNINQHLVIRE